MAKGGNRHAMRREKSIERLMHVALDLLKEKSFNAVRVEDITVRAGMAKGSLYMYFKGKEELYIKAIRGIYLQPLAEQIDLILGNSKPVEGLRGIVDYIFADTMHGQASESMFRAIMDKSLMELIRKELCLFLEGYLGSVEKMFTELGHENPKQKAYLYFVMLDGLYIYRILSLVGMEHWQSEKAADQLKKEILRIFQLK
ncbi:TetR/AcrR family transcriptional regulator [Gemmatimonadota bacterium]